MRARLFLAAVLCVLLAACGGGGGSNSDDFGPMRVIAPADKSFVQGPSVTIAVAGADARSRDAATVLLNGFDISKKFGQADQNGVRIATVFPKDVHYGKVSAR